jgi:hypothetical protein
MERPPKAKKIASCAASSPRGEPSCQIIQRASEDARISFERRRENHDCAIDDIGEAGKNVKTPGDPIYNPGCLALTRQQSYVVWPDKFNPDIGACYDGTTNPSNSSSSTSSPSRPRMEISVRWPIGSPWPSKTLRELGS